MKKFYITILSLSLFCLSQAQPVITQANYPSAGESYPAIALLTAPWTPGNSGENQTWDFSALTNPTNLTFEYQLPAATPYGATFSTSSLALNVIGQYSFFVSSASEYQVSGTVTSFPTTISRPYTNPQKIIAFPFTYLNTFKDTALTGLYPYGTDFQQRTTYTETKADGYGTVILPGGATFNNVLRLRTTAKTYDSTYNSSGSFIKEDISIDTNYYWVSQFHKPHIFTLTKSIQNNGSATVLAQYFGSPASVTSINKEYHSYFSVYPNPFSSELFVEVDENLFQSRSSISIVILNSNGKEVASYPMTSSRTRISGEDLPQGLYVYKILSQSQILSTGKLSVQ